MLDIVMHKALKEGATHLDSYAVKNDRKPSGLLPTLYAKHSWTISDSASYDPQYLGKTKTQRDKKEKALVESWEDQGWDRTLHGMPDVVFMTHERTASNATEFQRDDTEGVASSEGSGIRRQSAESAARDNEDLGPRSDGGESDRDAGEGGKRGSRKIHSFISELSVASENRLKAWGLTPESRDEIVNSEGVDPSFSLSRAQDANYLAAVESGDVEAQQRMVDEAAKAAGFKELYRGVDKDSNRPEGPVAFIQTDSDMSAPVRSMSFVSPSGSGTEM
ncbi:hypothetical protein N9911_02050 [Akkermansiaceae bacterium]|nr:hypothetical protein [Akkermansiaceae bacterium]MDB4276835.1 hypothetical protein [bacterium]MDA7518805.1 hypothetical protein [Akkermansiaceae bacterium]MDB4287011.1 hypothetical protein [Akkermansiaceae bacterium]MDB4299916.1 hypothetical protein [bacterium]